MSYVVVSCACDRKSVTPRLIVVVSIREDELLPTGYSRNLMALTDF